MRPAQAKQIEKLKSKLAKNKVEPVKKEETHWCRFIYLLKLFWNELKVEKHQ